MDLISRKAALEAVKIPNGEYSNPSERHGIIVARVEAKRRIVDIPSVPAVPLDRLCKWLSEIFVNIPCEYCQSFSNKYCTAIYDMNNPCPKSADAWRNTITKWMEGLDAAD